MYFLVIPFLPSSLSSSFLPSSLTSTSFIMGKLKAAKPPRKAYMESSHNESKWAGCVCQKTAATMASKA